MHRLSRVAIAGFMLFAAAIACDSPPQSYIIIERSAWSSDSQRIVLAIRDEESVNGEARVFNITQAKDKKPISTIPVANNAV